MKLKTATLLAIFGAAGMAITFALDWILRKMGVTVVFYETIEQRNNIQELLRDGKLTIEEYRELKNPIDSELFRLERDLLILNEETTPYKDYISQHVPMLENLLEFYKNSDGKTKKKILSCIFSEKIHFDENKVAAICFQKPIEVLLNASKVLQGCKKEKEVKIDLLPTLAPPLGLEPRTL